MTLLLPWSLVVALAPLATAAGQRQVGAPPAVARTAYAARREALAAAMSSDGVILALGGREPRADYVSFFQTTNFYYLTGMREPDAALVGVKQGATVAWTLFVQPKEPSREVWTGNRVRPENAESTWGVRALVSGGRTVHRRSRWTGAWSGSRRARGRYRRLRW